MTSVEKDYKNPFLDSAKHDQKITAGGYNLQEYYARAMFEAFAGMAVFVNDEKETGKLGLDFGDVATGGAGLAAQADGVGDEAARTAVKREKTEVKLEMDREVKQEAKGEDVVKVEQPIKMEVDD